MTIFYQVNSVSDYVSVCDMYVCDLDKFHHDLYLTTPSDAGMRSMLGSLEPTCHEEEVLERNATVLL